MSRILIAGCGYLGTGLGKHLASAGHEVWGLRRRVELVPEPIHPIQADLQQVEALSQIPLGLDFIFYTAAADRSDDSAYRGAYVVGIAKLIEALQNQKQQPRRIFFTSSTAVYDQTGGEWVDEKSPTVPRDFAGNRLLEGEGLLIRGTFPATIVRLGGIYGPSRTRLIDQVRSRSALLTEGKVGYSNRIHQTDCVGVLRHLMLLQALEEVYLGVDHEPTEQNTVVRWLAHRMGVPEPVPRSSKGTDYLPKAQDASTFRPRGKSAPGFERSNKRCRNDLLLRSGYSFVYPTFREGYAALLEEAAS